FACISFFFQAEDGIRDFHVTGVQTCALPIFDPIAELKRTEDAPSADEARAEDSTGDSPAEEASTGDATEASDSGSAHPEDDDPGSGPRTDGKEGKARNAAQH